MKKFFYLWAIVLLCSFGAFAQNSNSSDIANQTPGFYYVPPQPLPEAEKREMLQKLFKNRSLRSVSESRPRRWNNAETKHFPPVFNQADGSCGSASTIAYQFNHDINSHRDVDGSLEINQYPTHFTWLSTGLNSDFNETTAAMTTGIPNVATYGGRTYSQLFGRQTSDTPGYGLMQGYDKWYSAMFNRIDCQYSFGTLETEEAREWLKHWLWNHCGDEDYHSGGLAGTGLAAGGTWVIEEIPQGSHEAGKHYIKYWGKDYNHAMSFVGYDDDIEIDLNDNGVIEEDEKGAWIMLNSWGDWCDHGFVYCPYKNTRSTYNPETKQWGSWMNIGYLNARKNYKPKRTIKIQMNYSKRNEIRLSAGIAQDTLATVPEESIIFEYFKFAGGATPMLGIWKDGMHTESMEFGHDLTDLTNDFDQTKPLKYFFVVETKADATGNGVIDACSIIDYEYDSLGFETPFPDKNVTIATEGKKTIISVVVSPSQARPVNNFSLDRVNDTQVTLSWNKPTHSMYNLIGYRIYRNGKSLADLPTSQLQFTDPNAPIGACYQISAIYGFNGQSIESKLSERVVVKSNTLTAQAMTFNGNGFLIPDIFASSKENFTIEFWANPTSVRSWNWQIGPGWGTFMFHFNGYGSQGSLTAGFNSNNNRLHEKGSIKANKWSHIAIVVKKSTVSLYLNGALTATGTYSLYNGVSTIKNFSVGRASNDGIVGAMDEFRIWNTARTTSEIAKYYDKEIIHPELEPDLLVYYPMDTLPDGRLREAKNGYHATLLNNNCAYTDNCSELKPFTTDDTILTADFELPKGPFYTETPIEPLLKTTGYSSLLWNAPEANVTDKKVMNPVLLYSKAGDYKISLKVFGADGQVKEITKDITILPLEKPKADFSLAMQSVNVGERMSFINKSSGNLCEYEWIFDGGTPDTVRTVNAAISYKRFGDYTVTLIAKNSAGADTIVKKNIVKVGRITPIADFELKKYEVIVGEEITLKDLSKNDPTEWLWTVGNETIETYTEQNPTVRFAKPGVYSISLKASNDAGEHIVTKENIITVSAQSSGNALNFDGENDYVEVKDLFNTNSMNAFTIEWWMYAKGNVADGQQMGADASTILMQSNTLGSLKIMLGGEKNVLNVASTADKPFIKVGEWIHLALVFDNGRLTVYKNGKEITSKKFSGMTEAPAWVNGFNLGTGTGKTLNALIDEFRVWNVALSTIDIINHLNAPIANPENENGLELYYKFDQSVGNVIDTQGKHEGIRHNFGPDGDAWSTSNAFNVGLDATEIKITTSETDSATVNISYAGGAGKKRVVFLRKTDGAKAHPTDETVYTAVSTMTSATESMPGSGYVCIYNGNKESCSIEGLAPLTEYEVMIVEYVEIDRKPYYFTTSSHAKFTTGLYNSLTSKLEWNNAVSIYQTTENIHVILPDDHIDHIVSIYQMDGLLINQIIVSGELILSKASLNEGIYLLSIDKKYIVKVPIVK